MNLVFPCLFGLESLVARELRTITGSENIHVEDGLIRLPLTPEELASPRKLASVVARCNLYVSCAERCQLEFFEASCSDFDQFFDLIHAFPWEKYLSGGGRIRVDGYSRKSRLFGVPALQRLCKEAVVRRLLEARGLERGERLPEDPDVFDVLLRFALVNDVLYMRIELSGESLHKRGYRQQGGLAPLKETLAAGMLSLLLWPEREDEAFCDLFCGSGTLAIEAAARMTARAPGLDRRFAAQDWPYLPAGALAGERERASARHQERLEALRDGRYPRRRIYASDLSAAALRLARENAGKAGLAEWIEFAQGDALDTSPAALREHLGGGRVLLLSNPPYGERLSEAREVARLNRALGNLLLPHGELPPGWRFSIITSHQDFEDEIGYGADKRRKLYNGMISCNLYQYFRPGGREQRIRPRGGMRKARGCRDEGEANGLRRRRVGNRMRRGEDANRANR